MNASVLERSGCSMHFIGEAGGERRARPAPLGRTYNDQEHNESGHDRGLLDWNDDSCQPCRNSIVGENELDRFAHPASPWFVGISYVVEIIAELAGEVAVEITATPPVALWPR
jgi:hypothetical protein